MTSPHRILVPIDFSDISGSVVQVAAELARKYAAKLTLLHAYFLPPMPYGGPFAWVIDELRAGAQTALEKALQDAIKLYPDCEALLRAGDPRETILQIAKATAADWIVMGSCGHTAIGRFILGSVADYVIRRAEIPVLAVPLQRPALAISMPPGQ